MQPQPVALRLHPSVPRSVDLRQVEKLCGNMDPPAKIISLNPFTLEEVMDDCLRVGDALGLAGPAKAAVHDMQQRVEAVVKFAQSQPPLQLSNVCALQPARAAGIVHSSLRVADIAVFEPAKLALPKQGPL